MDLRTPMQLFRNQELVGLITAYSYETPWATGTLHDSDHARGARSDRATSYLQWQNETEDLPEDDDSYDRLCTQQLARHDVTQADVDWCEYGTWTIKTQDGLDHKAYSLEFLGDGQLQWRW
ncbi:hypothetical protein [Nocardia africana]|nr:hypothetical protein [Nocardia africana]MCC3313633.1 hypothetical protein [Nocardia africana]